MSSRQVLSAALAALIGGAGVEAAAPDPIPRERIVANVLQPQALSPLDERVQSVQLPDGFHIHRYADGLDNPRILRVADDGTVYVTQRNPGNVILLRDTDGDGVADVQHPVVEDVPQLHGLEIDGSTMYLTAIHHLWSAQIGPDGVPGPLAVLVDDLPDAGQHPNRTLRLGPDGALYLSVGSTCNACREPNPENAALLRIDPETGERQIFAAGLRNTIGFGWHPESQRLFGMDHNTDWLGDARPLEELNEIIEHGRYGWPFTYFDGDEERLMPHREPFFVSQELWLEHVQAPKLGYTAHAAPMEMVYYGGGQFPDEYRGDAFVAMRGSWNRDPAVGYEIVRVRFDAAGEPAAIEPFLSGFLIEEPEDAETPGFLARPVGLAVLPDGSLLMSDDQNDVIYRIAYGEDQPAPAPQRLASEIFADAPEVIEVSSPAIEPEGWIDFRFTDYGEGVSPPLAWSGVPDGTRALVLLLEDPDAASPVPFVHWLLANIGEQRRALPPGIDRTWRPQLGGPIRQGSNSNSVPAYFGPRTPPGDGPHEYHFQLFALDRRLDLPEGFNRQAVIDAMSGHVIGRGSLVATFEMPLPEQGIGPEEEEQALLDVPGWDPEGDAPGL